MNKWQLWATVPFSAMYWQAFLEFLNDQLVVWIGKGIAKDFRKLKQQRLFGLMSNGSFTWVGMRHWKKYIKRPGRNFLSRIKVMIYLSQLLRGHTVLIVGTGSSVKDLTHIPRDVKVLTCKYGLKLFDDNGFNRLVDLYQLTPGFRAVYQSDFETLIGSAQLNILLCKQSMYKRVKKRLGEKETWRRSILCDTSDYFYLNSLIKPLTAQSIRESSEGSHLSSGMKLLQFALYFKAKEIYMIGIDLGKKGYFWGASKRRWHHDDIDENFLAVVTRRHNNIYSLSRSSPVTRYIPYRLFTKGT